MSGAFIASPIHMVARVPCVWPGSRRLSPVGLIIIFYANAVSPTRASDRGAGFPCMLPESTAAWWLSFAIYISASLRCVSAGNNLLFWPATTSTTTARSTPCTTLWPLYIAQRTPFTAHFAIVLVLEHAGTRARG